MSAADTLRAAADRLDELAGAATPGPWHVPRRGTGIDAGDYDTVIGPGDVSCMAYCYGGSSTITGDNLAADQALIATLADPEVGKALAAWLRETADRTEWFAPNPFALAVARLILRDTEDER